MALSQFQKTLALRIAAPWQISVQNGITSARMPGKVIALPVKRPALAAVLQGLEFEGKTIATIESELQNVDAESLGAFKECFDFLMQNLLLGWEWPVNGNAAAIIIPLSPEFCLEEIDAEIFRDYVFSRFALLRRDEGAWVLESPLLCCSLQVLDPGILLLLHAFSRPLSGEKALGTIQQPSGIVLQWMKMLVTIGFLEPVLMENEANKPEREALQYWEFHDLYFHSRTRLGRHNNAVGRSLRFSQPPPPPYKPYSHEGKIFLPKPDVKSLKQKEITLYEAMELRKSNKKHGLPAINFKELGEFFFRVARIKGMYPKDEYVIAQRPYPNAGGSNEIELYVLIKACVGLPEGFYWYEPVEHALVQVQQKSAETEALYLSTNYNNKADFAPQVIVFLASRFARNSWKYQTLSYANTLKHVGVLFQSMYLVATAMGLAPNGWSIGNSDLFNKVSGTNYYEETSVGEFLLGAPGT